ncbi:MAG: class I SAM-dependent rRNA methyltransferase [Candidatus Latescibacterota bacterium]|nr:class I SAM-dependent rRNA methyltransferase [Candidatus Latescibacterota bacterium]
MQYPQLILRQGSEHTVRNGHPWIFSGSVAHKPDTKSGTIVDVMDNKKQFVCRGTYNARAMIRVRALTRNPEEIIDENFISERLQKALNFRTRSKLYDCTNAVRLVHGEADGLPGLIVDDYDGFLVVQFHTLGMENLKEMVLNALEAVLNPKGIYERSDVGTRRAEGLKTRPTGKLRGMNPPDFVEIVEHHVNLSVDIYHGQKTGYFIDQRANRFQLQKLAAQADVLNLFSYSSAFSAHALKGGAKSTIDVDISVRSPYAAKINIEKNRGDCFQTHHVVADAFNFIETLSRKGPRYDVVVVDPPSIVRKRDKNGIKKALGIYTKLNRNALRTTQTGGIIMTSSCSTPVTNEDFFNTISRAAAGAKVDLRILAVTSHCPDHPINPFFPDGRYLKSITAEVLR